MFASHFFIPADKPRFIEKIKTLDCTHIIFDMEESVHSNNLQKCIQNLSTINIQSNYSVRFPVNYIKIKENADSLKQLFALGFRSFTLPKIESIQHFKNTLEFFNSNNMNDVRFNVYIETPMALINLKSMVEKYHKIIDNILLGSHDFCNAMGSKHTTENLLYLRQKNLTIGKAYGVNVIDIVTPNICDLELLKTECVDSFNMGFDGKALIHPLQLEAFNTALYFTKTEVEEAYEVNKELNKLGPDKFSIIKINGKIYEKPHIKRIFDIIEWNKKGGYYDL